MHFTTRISLIKLLAGCCIVLFPAPIFCQTATTAVDLNSVVNPNAKLLLGITMDGRTGMNANAGYVGYFDPSGNLIPNIDTLFDDFPLNGLRYPGQAVMTGFEWKKAIGAMPRPFQNLLGVVGPAQSMDFGFDEFMTYCESKGLFGNDIQIMLPIYDSAITYVEANKNKARVPFPASNAADWVEYANAPSNVNWGGGIAWGAVRAANGHPAPYNIKTWNIGNEPWGPFEMNFDSSQYFPIAKPIIDSMLARDPTLHITIPTTGNANNNWNKMIRSHKRMYGDIYGVSPHFFTNGLTVDLVESTLRTLIDSCKAVGMEVIVGDFSHEILPGNSALEQNRAMSWKGVNYSLDMLLMFSQLNTIESTNHWAFGNTTAGWHPIRKEPNGSYTMLAIGNFYRIISPYFRKQSLSVASNSPIASDSHPYSLRASAFENANHDTISVVALNRYPATSLTYGVTGLGAFRLYESKILSSDSLTGGQIIYSTDILPDINENFTLPASTILLLSYTSTVETTAIEENVAHEFTPYPNPSAGEFTLSSSENLVQAQVRIIDNLGQVVYSIAELNGNEVTLNIKLGDGVYYLQLRNGSHEKTKTILIRNTE